MATSIGASPSTPCVGVPVVQGYPCPPPPPPPPPPSTSGGATPDQDKCSDLTCNLICLCVALPIMYLFCLLISSAQDDLPTFKLDSVSVSVNNITSLCDIDIGFSIDRSVGDLQVWARFMSRDYKVESNGRAGNSTVSVSVMLARVGSSFPSGVTLEQVAFKSNNYVKNRNRFFVEAACVDIPVEISSNETRGLMLHGGPRLCPVVYHNSLPR